MKTGNKQWGKQSKKVDSIHQEDGIRILDTVVRN
jgi:hypothetical protein